MRKPTFLLLALMGGCDLTSPRPDFRQLALEETARQETLWKAKDVHSYDFDFQRDCSGCTATATQQVRIHVRNDVITRVVAFQGSDVAPQTGISWPSVDSLFLWSRQFLDNSSFAVELDFDTTYHFPSFVHGEVPGFLAELASGGLVEQTSTAPIRVGESYFMAEKLSKSKRVTWRSR